jgi:hypothetical protein
MLNVLTLLRRLYFRMLDACRALDWADPPRFYMQRLPKGGARARLQGRGSARRLRRTSLRRLLGDSRLRKGCQL